MPSPAVRTDRTDCACGARVILARDVPPLDYAPDPAGTVAARHAASGAWQARWWNPGDVLAVLEKRYRVHECGEGP
jgi:hypothetical protein